MDPPPVRLPPRSGKAPADVDRARRRLGRRQARRADQHPASAGPVARRPVDPAGTSPLPPPPRELWQVPVDGGRALNPRGHAGEPPDGRFSPRRRGRGLVSTETGRPEVIVAPLLGRGRQQVSTGGVRPRWRKDGRELFYFFPGTDDGRGAGAGTAWMRRPRESSSRPGRSGLWDSSDLTTTIRYDVDARASGSSSAGDGGLLRSWSPWDGRPRRGSEGAPDVLPRCAHRAGHLTVLVFAGLGLCTCSARRSSCSCSRSSSRT
jgi:hypothetical protein